jgi:hypothetical protein
MGAQKDCQNVSNIFWFLKFFTHTENPTAVKPPNAQVSLPGDGGPESVTL